MKSVYDVGSTVEIGAIRSGDSRQHGRDQPVERRDSLRGETDQRGAGFAVSRRSRLQAEAAEAVDGGEHRGQHDHDPGQPQSVLRKLDPAEADRGARKDRRRRGRCRAEVEDGDGLEIDERSDRRGDARQRRRRPKRPVDEQIEDRPEDQRVQERNRDRERARETGARKRDAVRQDGPGQFERPARPQVDVDVGDEHGHRAVAKVHDLRTAVLEHQPDRQEGVDRAGAQAEQQEEQVGGHGGYGWREPRLPTCSPPRRRRCSR